jgi:diguanylate cyclase
LTRRTTGQEIGSVTVSIGVAQFRPGEPAEVLLERCDRGLYQAKTAGRNRVVTEIEIDDKIAA